MSTKNYLQQRHLFRILQPKTLTFKLNSACFGINIQDQNFVFTKEPW